MHHAGEKKRCPYNSTPIVVFAETPCIEPEKFPETDDIKLTISPAILL